LNAIAKMAVYFVLLCLTFFMEL